MGESHWLTPAVVSAFSIGMVIGFAFAFLSFLGLIIVIFTAVFGFSYVYRRRSRVRWMRNPAAGPSAPPSASDQDGK